MKAVFYTKLVLLLPILVVALQGADIVWENTGTDWGTGANWVGDAVPTNDVSTDVAIFNSATTTFQPNLGSAFSVNGIDFRTSGWTLSGSDLTVGTYGIDVQSGLSATLNLNLTDASTSNYEIDSGATLTLNGAFNSTGSFVKNGTGTILLTGNQAMSGNKNVNYGALNFSGNTTTGSGRFLIGDVSTTTNGSMSLLAGASLTAEDVYIGDEGTGVLNISAGSDLIVTDVLSFGGNLGGDATSSGTLNADGAGTTITTTGTGFIYVGGINGSAVANITGGATMIGSSQLRVGNGGTSGTLNVSGSGSRAQGTLVYIGRSGTASASVSSDAVVESTSDIYVGDDGNGTLALSSGADLISGNNLRVGDGNAAASGILTADGAGTTLTVSNVTLVGGSAGAGTVTLSNGAIFNSSGDMRLGTGATGTLNASGSGTQVNSTNFRVGYTSTGEANFSDNAQLTATGDLTVGNSSGGSGTFNLTSGADATVTGSFRVGYLTGSSGTASLSGSGTTLTNNYTYVGNQSGTNGILNITDGATMNTGTGELRIGSTTGAVGTLNLTGAGSQITTTNIRVSLGGSGIANVSDNALLTGSAMVVGSLANSNGGTLNIRSGATVTTTGNIWVDYTGAVIDMEGGTLNSGGSIIIRSGAAINGYGTINQDISNSGSMDIDGTMSYGNVISGSGTLTKSNSGTLTLTGSNTYTGQTTVSGGKLSIGASNVISNSSNLEISGEATVGFSGNFSEVVGDLSVGAGGGTLSFDGNSEFLFNNDGTFNDILVIENWDSVNDKFGMIDSALAVADKIKFVGFGGSALIAGSTSTIAGGTGYLITGDVNGFEVWDGGTNTNPDWNFNSDENWVGNVAPVSGDTLNLEFAGTTNLAPEMTSSYTANTLKFAAGSGAFTLNDNGGSEVLTLAGVLPSIVNDSTNNQIINHAIQLGDGSNPNGSLVIGGSGSGDFTINGVVSDPSGTYGITKVGAFKLTLNGTNTYTGSTVLQSGTLSISSDANLGATSAGLAFAGGALEVTSSFTLSSSRSVAITPSSNLNITSGNTLTYGGTLTGNGDLILSDAGTFVLTGNSTHTGDLIINNGVLNLSTGTVDSNIKLSGGALYGGTTANAIAGALEITSGTLSAATNTTAGNMQITGSATSYLTAGTFVWNVSGLTDSGTDSDGNGANEVTGTAGTHWDILSFTGALTFENATTDSIVVQMSNIGSTASTWGAGYKELKIIEASGGIVGFNDSYFKFDTDSWTDGGGWWYDWKVIQKGNALWLQYQAVPEPGTWFMIFALSGILGMGAFRKIRKKGSLNSQGKP